MKNLDRVKTLFEKYLNRTASSAELDEMFQLLGSKADFEALYDLFEEEWESSDVEFKMDGISWEEMRLNIEAPKYNASLKKISTAKGYSRFWKITSVAASLLFLLGMFFWISVGHKTKEYTTGFGETMEIVLDDQSSVILNANSKLVWHLNWQNSRERKVELEGEAFFNVKKYNPKSKSLKSPDSNNNLMPFRVITPDLTVNVLGTSFNVLARRQTTDVYLESGEVVLTMNNTSHPNKEKRAKRIDDLTVQYGEDSIYMVPGDHVSYTGNTRSLVRLKSTIDQFQAPWTSGNLVFENEPLKSALEVLEDIYGKTFEVEDSTLLERPVDLGLPYEDWETVSGLMTLSLELKFIETGNKVTVKRK